MTSGAVALPDSRPAGLSITRLKTCRSVCVLLQLPRQKPVTQVDDGEFLTTEEVLGYLHVNLRTVYRLIKAGKIPAVRVGRQWRFRKRDVDRWLDSQSSRPTTALPAEPASVPGRKRVLVVDDEPAIRDMLSRTLVMADYEVETADDGLAALARMRMGGYDLLVADLNMPDMDGLALIKLARSIREGLAVIIVTGCSSELSAIEAVNLGVSGYLTKPFRIPEVLETARRALAG
jgi:excisionase family DNA binding protein